MSDLITEKQARENGFSVLAGPFSFNEMDMADKFIGEARKNQRHAALVQRIKGKRKNKITYYEVWQKSQRHEKGTSRSVGEKVS